MNLITSSLKKAICNYFNNPLIDITNIDDSFTNDKFLEYDLAIICINTPHDLKKLDYILGYNELKILIVSSEISFTILKESFKLGTNGLMFHINSVMHFEVCLSCLHEDKKYIDPLFNSFILEHIIDKYNGFHEKVKILTKRETEIMELIPYNSNQDISSKLSISLKTISVHKSNIILKLNLSNNKELDYFAYQMINKF